MVTTHTAAACGLHQRSISRGVIAGVFTALVMAVALASSAPGNQITPLEDVVPLTELEVATDDLVRIATSMADAVREFRTAELSVKTLQKLQPNAAITGLEMQVAMINARTAQSKVRILRAIAEKQLAIAQARLEFLRRLGQDGEAEGGAVQASPRITQAEATVEILRMILDIK